MSKLNQALSKIYGQPHAQVGAASENVEQETKLDAATPADQAILPPLALSDLRVGLDSQDDSASLETKSEDQAIDSLGGNDDVVAHIDAPSLVELPSASLSVESSASDVVEPPHFSLSDIESSEVEAGAPAEQLDVDAVQAEAEQAEADDQAEFVDASQDAIEESQGTIEDAPEETEQKAGGDESDSEAILPEWEVDRFRWPETCQRLLLDSDEGFTSAIETFCNMGSQKCTIVALVGHKSNAGTTTTALCLARHAAQLGRRVLLVDADISEPKLATAVGLNAPCSWHDSISGDAPLAESIVLSVEDQLCLMPLHTDCQQSELKLSDPRVAELLRAAGSTNELVILDCGSIERLSERAESGEGLPCDVAVVVRKSSQEHDADAIRAAEKLQLLGADHIAFAENFVRESKPVSDSLKRAAA